MGKLLRIYEGWSKALGLVEVSDENKELARKRLDICIKCPHAKEQWLKKFIDGALKRDKAGSGIGCGICGCPVNEKALVVSEKCPVGSW